MAKLKPKPIEPNTADRFFTAILGVLEKETRRTEIHIEIEGKKFLAMAYRLNDAVPVRVDFKASK